MLKTIDRKKGSSEERLDAELAKMKRLPRGSFKVMRGATDLKNCKVKITLYVDADVLEFFKKRAEQPNAAPYQTQINNELRKIMESGSADAQTLEKAMLNDKKFLKALKKK